MKTEFLIVGQGLAGTCLAHQLIEQDKSVRIIKNSILPSSSKVAGGMFNPVTGKRLARTWKQQELFTYLDEFYSYIESKLNIKLLHKIQIFRPYKNENQKSQFKKAIEHKNLNDTLSDIEIPEQIRPIIKADLGGILTRNSGRLDVNNFLNISAEYFEKMGVLIEEDFKHDYLTHTKQHIVYKDIKYKKIIFCEGIHALKNPYFNRLPFNLVKGETLDVKLHNLDLDLIINQGAWVMPLGDGVFKMGSTYDWDKLDFNTTPEAREQILEKSKNFLRSKPEVIFQSAGIRPAVVDRRPLLGSHPKFENIYIFNGLGTKGVSLAPFFSKQLAEHLISGKEIDIESTIKRFYPLYS